MTVVGKELTELRSMYQFSDSDSVDSDEGIRYKTESIRNKNKSSGKNSASSEKNSRHSHRERKRSRSPRYHEHNEKQKAAKRMKKEHSLRSDFDRKDSKRVSSRSKTKDDDDRDARKHKEREKNSRKLHKESNNYQVDREGPTSSGQLVIKSNEHCKASNAERVEKSVPFGPVLPPRKHKSLDVSPEEVKVKDENKSIGPVIPAHICKVTSNENFQNEDKLINSLLPPHFVTVSSLEDDSSDEIVETVGPDLPPDLKEIDSYIEPSSPKNTEHSDALKQNVIVGPTLPPHLLKKDSEKDKHEVYGPTPPEEPADITIGPEIPVQLRQKLSEVSSVRSIEEAGIIEDDEVYGPIPVGESYSKAHIELEERALKIKMDQLEPAEDKQANREEWMLTLPAKAASFGLGPRQFRAKAGPDLSDRSSWTDTPEDKAKKKAGKVEPKIDLKKEAELKEIKRRDKEQEAIAKKNKKHKESLVDMHAKKLKKDKKSESEPNERRPFSREIDLQVNRFDEAQKKAVLKKAQLLDTRFSAGESKFL